MQAPGQQPPATPGPPALLDEAGIETDAAIDRIFHGKKVDYEMAEVHDKFVIEEFKGDQNLHEPRTDLSVHLPENQKEQGADDPEASEAPLPEKAKGMMQVITDRMADRLRSEGLSIQNHHSKGVKGEQEFPSPAPFKKLFRLPTFKDIVGEPHSPKKVGHRLASALSGILSQES